MNLKSALRWTAMYRAATWAAGFVFLAFLGAAVYLGLGDVVRTAVYGNPARLANPAFSGPPILLALMGFAVWQVTKTVAFYKTVTEATEEQMASRFDSERVKSEVLEVLDDRLSEMQSEVQRTRREVQDMDSGGGATTGAAAGAGNAGSSGSFDFES